MPPREILAHHQPGLNALLRLHVMDTPNAEGVCSHYRVQCLHSLSAWFANRHVHFQQGRVEAHGVNGLSNEVVLAIVRDRLQGAQAGPHPSPDTAAALAGVEQALQALRRCQETCASVVSA